MATWISFVYNRNSNTDPCGTPQVILEILNTKPLIDANCLRSAKYNWITCLLIHVFHNDTIYATEFHDPQCQKPSDGLPNYHIQSYHHQELSLLPQSDLLEHMRVNNATES